MNMKKNPLLECLSGILLLIAAFMSLMTVNAQVPIGISILVVEVIVVALKFLQRNENKRAIAECVAFSAAAIVQLLWLITRAFPLYIAAILIAILLAIYLVVCVLIRKSDKPRGMWRKLGKGAAWVAFALAVLLTGLYMINAITPAPFIHVLQGAFGVSNSVVASEEAKQNTLADDVQWTSDIKYADTYPNSYLDVYTSGDTVEEATPTFFFIHGGGYAWGDKAEGDPNAGESGGLYGYFKTLLNAGYNIVSVNYAFTPEYTYPTPIYQMGEAVKFLQENGQQYGIDMTNVVIGGSSAGGQIAGQFINVQTNPAYAAEMGITPVITREHLKAAVFASSLLDNERFAKTGDRTFDWMFLGLGRAYFECNVLEGQANVIQSNVITHATADFPPAFISDGNNATFNDQALDLHNQLDQLGVKNTFNFYEASVAELSHGYETGDSAQAQDNLVKLVAFLGKVE